MYDPHRCITRADWIVNSLQPSNVKISDVTFKNIKGTSFTKLAVNLICSAKYPCKNIQMEDINLTHQDTQQKTAAMCLNTQPTVSGTMDPPPCD